MSTRLCLAILAVACTAATTLAQPLKPLFNPSLDLKDQVWFGNPRPQGYRLFNTASYRRTDDGQLPAATTRNASAGAIVLPGALGSPASQFVGVQSEEFRDPNDPLSGRNWPEYTFDPISGKQIRISCWFNIPADDPLVGGWFGMKVCFLRSGSNLSCYQEFEWQDVKPDDPTPYPGTIFVASVPPPPGSGLTAGAGLHTNGQWVKFERIFSQSEFGSFPIPPTNPARASLFALRFSADTNSYGTVVVDDLKFEEITTCVADFDGNGTRTIDDIFIFLNSWFAGCNGTQAGAPCFNRNCDVDNSGNVSIDDIFIFINIWFAGC